MGTEPGRHQRARVTAAVLVMAGALFVTYGGATLFSFATDRAAIFPVPPVIRPSTHRATPAPAHTGIVTPPPPSPSPAGTVTAPPPPPPSTSPPPPPPFTQTPTPPIG